MKINAAFWDTSAVIPLCVQQDSSQQYRQLWRNSSRIVAWWGTQVEIRSAMARLSDEGVLDFGKQQFVLRRLESLRRRWAEIVPSEKVRNMAETLPDLYGLRALDSFQLAAALVWCGGATKGRFFVCDDAKLSVAASKAGFSVVP